MLIYHSSTARITISLHFGAISFLDTCSIFLKLYGLINNAGRLHDSVLISGFIGARASDRTWDSLVFYKRENPKISSDWKN